jgi:hypothetical protein
VFPTEEGCTGLCTRSDLTMAGQNAHTLSPWRGEAERRVRAHVGQPNRVQGDGQRSAQVTHQHRQGERSTVLTLVVIPVLYLMWRRREIAAADKPVGR